MRAGQNNGRIASNWAGIRRSFHRTEECLGVYLKFVVSMILSFLPMCYIYYSNTTLSLSLGSQVLGRRSHMLLLGPSAMLVCAMSSGLPSSSVADMGVLLTSPLDQSQLAPKLVLAKSVAEVALGPPMLTAMAVSWSTVSVLEGKQ
jgi:hypothetical protein